MIMTKINPFVPNAPFLYFLKTLENLTVFCCFQGIWNKWVNKSYFNGTNNLSVFKDVLLNRIGHEYDTDLVINKCF